ncbi:MAG: NapC/NirT family cytochrome c [Candidatus Krumholzibacteriota bacterium]
MKRFQLFIRGIMTNWTGTAGVALATSSFILFLFFELLQIAGILNNSYVGLISYMALPALFILGLVLIPLGWWQFRRATGRTTSELLTQRFPDDMTKAKRLGSSLMGTISLLTVINILFLGVGGARMLHFMDTPKFCGTACHSVMEPEWVAYQNSPHAHVRCIDCHVGEGAGALVNAKLNGMWQVISASLDLYDRPIPTPVHQLRPARETCEKCHWPDKFYGDRIKSFQTFGFDRESAARHTTLALKVGSGAGDAHGTIHWHIAEANEVRYQTADDQRRSMEWVEIKRGDEFHRYTNRNNGVHGGGDTHSPEVRSMDCVDCHNRATHIYEDPEQAVDAALAAGRISRDLPFAKKVGLGALLGRYGVTKDDGLKGIDNEVRGYYFRQEHDGPVNMQDVDLMVAALQDIYARNIFPGMKVEWNTYPSHLGHENDGGCFRCHNQDMVDETGAAIPYDCTLCHSILAMDSPTEFQFLLPADVKDPDRKMHEYLRREFLGIPQGVFPEPDSTETREVSLVE